MNLNEENKMAGNKVARAFVSDSVINNTYMLNVNGDLGLESYNLISQRLKLADIVPSISGIKLYINSPGGDDLGLFECCNNMLKCEKRIITYTDGWACSAAYALASCGDYFYCAPSSRVGSIGVYFAHDSIKEKLKKEGTEHQEFVSGDLKRSLSSYEPISEEYGKILQARVEKFHNQFINLVKSRRRLIDPEVFRGAIYYGYEAVHAGLCDGLINDRSEIEKIN